MTDTFLRLYVYGLTGVVAAWALYVSAMAARALWRRLVRGPTHLHAMGGAETPAVRAAPARPAPPTAPLRAHHRQHVDA